MNRSCLYNNVFLDFLQIKSVFILPRNLQTKLEFWGSLSFFCLAKLSHDLTMFLSSFVRSSAMLTFLYLYFLSLTFPIHTSSLDDMPQNWCPPEFFEHINFRLPHFQLRGGWGFWLEFFLCYFITILVGFYVVLSFFFFFFFCCCFFCSRFQQNLKFNLSADFQFPQLFNETAWTAQHPFT